VTIQAQILELMQDLARRLGVAMLIITHNLGVVARYADRVNVMYAGRIVERGTVHEVFKEPLHPYTQGLLASVIDLDTTELHSIPGQPPDLLNPPSGCPFHPRCPMVMPHCSGEIPPTTHPRPGRSVACYLHPG